MTQEELDKIIEQHQHWIKEDCEGWEDMKANLRGADLSGANLSRTNLSGADLSGADLSRTNLRGANLSGAYLSWTYLSGADLSGANLRGADLSRTYLSGADLSGANLSGAYLSRTNLSGADLSGANLSWTYLSGADLSWTDLSRTNLRGADLSRTNLSRTNLSGANQFRLGKVLDEPLTGYKKTKEGVVITAEIPAGAIVFCINGSKCRTNRAKITDMNGHKILHSEYDNSFEYRLGQEINIKDFNLMYNVECASGFHFFRTRKEAEEYN